MGKFFRFLVDRKAAEMCLQNAQMCHGRALKIDVEGRYLKMKELASLTPPVSLSLPTADCRLPPFDCLNPLSFQMSNVFQ